MTPTAPTPDLREEAAGPVRQFRLDVAEEDVADLRPRLTQTRWENSLGCFDVKGVTVSAAVSVFPRELYRAPRRWTELASPNLVYFNEVDQGNHFAAWQEPDLFVTEVRAGFRSLP
jgi:hypothetical protein